MTEFVVCPACGTRIKAGRPHCLRCFELLPLPGEKPRPSILVAMSWSRGTKAMAGVGASLAVLFLAIIWQTTPSEATAAAPAATPARTRSSGPFATSRRPAPAAVATIAPAAEPVVPPNGDEPFMDTPSGSSDGDGSGYQAMLAHFKVARAAVDAGKWNRAIEEYGAAARLSPVDAAAQYNLALALHRRGDERDAIATFHKAIALAPTAAAFHLPLAAAYENVGQLADAAREYQVFVTDTPEAFGADRARARIEVLSTGKVRGAATR